MACGGSPTQPWDGQVRVAGAVRDFRTNAAIGGARVTIGDAAATTDRGGLYALSVPAGEHPFSIDGEAFSPLTMRDPTYRGDFFVHVTGCVARYGTVVDTRSRRPVSGAALSLSPVVGAPVTTDQTGWFQVTAGCDVQRLPDLGPCVGFNTTLLFVTHPNYVTRSFPVGRGFCGVDRVDYELDPR